ncbi:MAG: hypothetical protein WD851_00410 [Pirellulales bacterium]
MSEPTKTIAFRVAQSIERQIDELAKASGQSKGEWVRDQILQVLGAASPPPDAQSQPPAEPEDRTNQRDSMQAQISGVARCLRNDIRNVKTAIEDSDRNRQKELCQLGLVSLDVQELLEERIEAMCLDILDAIERVKQSQRSHKDTVLRAITETR